MSRPPRPNPGRRRRRPGRRPPNRFTPAGFTGFGADSFYRVVMPGLQGSRKREYFNAIAGGLVYALAAAGAAVCLLTFGPLGALAGLAGGAAAGGLLADRGRFFRR